MSFNKINGTAGIKMHSSLMFPSLPSWFILLDARYFLKKFDIFSLSLDYSDSFSN